MNRWLARFPKLWKILGVYILNLSLTISACYCVYWAIQTALHNQGITLALSDWATPVVVRYLGLAAFMSFLLSAFMYWDNRNVVAHLNHIIQDALGERRLDQAFSDLYKGQKWSVVLDNLGRLFGTFKSLDMMKTARIGHEKQTVSMLVNQISEGIILVNAERIVTHINHVAEEMLGLIPGEILGQSIVRKMSSEALLERLDLTLDNHQKTANHPIELSSSKTVWVTILPIQDKFTQSTQAVIIIKPENPELANQDEL